MSKLLEYAVNTEFYKDFINKIETLDEVHIENSNDNINLLSLLVLFQQKNENMVLVTPNLYKAQKLFDSLSSLLPDEQISFFPQDEFLTTEMLAMSSDFKIERGFLLSRKQLQNWTFEFARKAYSSHIF